MNQERLMQVLRAPLVTEKSTRAAEVANQVVFRVATDATKAEVKKAVEAMFSVEVQGVQIANQRGKTKRFGQMFGKRGNWKKAYVRLKAGQTIDFVGGAK